MATPLARLGYQTRRLGYQTRRVRIAGDGYEFCQDGETLAIVPDGDMAILDVPAHAVPLWRRYAAEEGAAPPEVQTPSGGLHVYGTLVACEHGTVGDGGIEVRKGPDGWVLAPGVEGYVGRIPPRDRLGPLPYGPFVAPIPPAWWRIAMVAGVSRAVVDEVAEQHPAARASEIVWFAPNPEGPLYGASGAEAAADIRRLVAQLHGAQASEVAPALVRRVLGCQDGVDALAHRVLRTPPAAAPGTWPPPAPLEALAELFPKLDPLDLLTEGKSDAMRAFEQLREEEFSYLRQLPGVRMRNELKRLHKRARDAYVEAQREAAASASVRALPELPESAVCPAAYRLDDVGTWARSIDPDKGDRLLYNGVVYPRSLLADDVTGDLYVELAYRWAAAPFDRVIVPMTDAADHRAMVKLAARSVPVTSRNAAHIVGFVNDFIAVNLEAIPRRTVHRDVGWVVGLRGFLAGEHWIGPPPDVRFAEGGNGEQIARGMVAVGEARRQIDVLESIGDCAGVMAAVGAALAATLLSPMRCTGFVLSLTGESSSGKTAAARVAGSVWGSTEHDRDNSLVNSWDCTATWVERVASALDGVPLILDDTRGRASGRDDEILKVVYDATSGRSRGRATRDAGTRRIEGSPTLVISTGEARLSEQARAGGAFARMLEVTKSPWGRGDRSSLVDSTLSELTANYGHIGRAWARHVVDGRSRWSTWRKEIEVRVKEMAGEVTVDERGLATRMSRNAELVVTSLFRARDAGIIRLADEQIYAVRELLISDISSKLRERDYTADCLRLVLTDIGTRRGSYYDGHSAADPTRRPDAGGWRGTWHGCSKDGLEEGVVYVLDSTLRDLFGAEWDTLVDAFVGRRVCERTVFGLGPMKLPGVMFDLEACGRVLPFDPRG